jgi:NTE family protein
MLDTVGAMSVRLSLPTKSLLSNTSLRRAIQQIGGNTRIEDLNVPLAVVATDLSAQQEVVFRRGLAWSAVLASISIPGIYPAQRIGSSTLVDGGVLNPVPINVVAEMGADLVLAVKLVNRSITRVEALEAREPASDGSSLIRTFLQAIDLMQSSIGTETASAATILIEPALKDVARVELRNFTQGRRFIEQGEAAAESALPRIAASLPWVSK